MRQAGPQHPGGRMRPVRTALLLMLITALGADAAGEPAPEPAPAPAPEPARTPPGEFERGKQALAAKDYATAARHFRHGAFRGDALSQHSLGVLLLQGAGIQQDDRAAALWFRRAARQGLGASANALASLHMIGRGVKKDPRAAARWFRRTALHGDPAGATALGLLHLQGLGVAKDEVDAAVWLTLGARAGHPSAAQPLQQLEPRLSDEQRAEVARRVAAFTPRKSKDQSMSLDPGQVPEVYMPSFVPH